MSYKKLIKKATIIGAVFMLILFVLFPIIKSHASLLIDFNNWFKSNKELILVYHGIAFVGFIFAWPIIVDNFMASRQSVLEEGVVKQIKNMRFGLVTMFVLFDLLFYLG